MCRAFASKESAVKFKAGDRVRYRPNVNAAYGPPDRRSVIGIVKRSWSEPANHDRIDVLFDGEADLERGLEGVRFELAE